jgi:hypothetical protein
MPASAKAAIVPFGTATTVAPTGDGVVEVLLSGGTLMEAKESGLVSHMWEQNGKMSDDPLVERLKASDGQ